VPAITVTSNTTVVVLLAAMLMPDTVIAPRPLAPFGIGADELEAPDGIEKKPANVVLVGMLSVTETLGAGCPADSISVMEYRSVSPGATSPPLRSTTLLVEVDRFGPTTVAVSVELLLLASMSMLVELTVTVLPMLGYAA